MDLTFIHKGFFWNLWIIRHFDEWRYTFPHISTRTLAWIIPLAWLEKQSLKLALDYSQGVGEGEEGTGGSIKFDNFKNYFAESNSTEKEISLAVDKKQFSMLMVGSVDKVDLDVYGRLKLVNF